MILSIYEDFGFADVRIKFSDRPEKRIGEDAVWDKAETALMQALEASRGNGPWTLNKGEGAFYGPKLEYVLRDAIGRDWQCGTVQVDFNMPGRLGAFYIDDRRSNKITPVMLHRAMFGSLERFTGILIEHYAGHFPLWLSPVQAMVATITDDADDYAREVVAAAQRAGLRVDERSAEREDQLQGARAFAGQGAGDAGGRARRRRPSAPSRSAGSARRARPSCRSTPRSRRWPMRRSRRTCGGRPQPRKAAIAAVLSPRSAASYPQGLNIRGKDRPGPGPHDGSRTWVAVAFPVGRRRPGAMRYAPDAPPPHER